MTRIVALGTDLMDRSRLTAAVPATEVIAAVEQVDRADIVIVDLARHASSVAEIRRRVPDALVVAYGPHIDAELLAAARADGADRVMARSRFFSDPKSAIDVSIGRRRKRRRLRRRASTPRDTGDAPPPSDR